MGVSRPASDIQGTRPSWTPPCDPVVPRRTMTSRGRIRRRNPSKGDPAREAVNRLNVLARRARPSCVSGRADRPLRPRRR